MRLLKVDSLEFAEFQVATLSKVDHLCAIMPACRLSTIQNTVYLNCDYLPTGISTAEGNSDHCEQILQVYRIHHCSGKDDSTKSK